MSTGRALLLSHGWQVGSSRSQPSAQAWCGTWNGARSAALTGAIPSADVSEALWTVPADKIKQELHLRSDEAFDHKIPLSSQAVQTLRVVRLLTGRAPYVFPNARAGTSAMTENAIGYLYNREGYKGKHVPHGWRSSFSTIMNEQAERELGTDLRLLADRLIIDLMLAHTPAGMSATELRYNRARYMDRRRELANDGPT